MKQPSTASASDPDFSLAGLLNGLLASLPLGAAALPYGVVYGVLAGRTGLQPGESIATSILVYSGSAQFAALELWSRPPVIAALVFAVLAMNARYVLYGALLRPHLPVHAPAISHAALFLLGDANWAMLMRRARHGPLDGGFAIGSGLAMFAGWVTGTIIGALAGDLPPDLARYGVDFLLPAFFATMLAALWRGRADIAPIIAAIAAALVAHWLQARAGTVIAGGLAGAATAALRHGR